MRRRLATILSAAMLSTALLLPMSALPAFADATPVVLAAAGHGTDAGLEPMDADNTENAFAPAQYEPNWTWRAGGKGLLALIVGAALLIGVLYYVQVSRPARNAQS